jgi:hypothetical protein
MRGTHVMPFVLLREGLLGRIGHHSVQVTGAIHLSLLMSLESEGNSHWQCEGYKWESEHNRCGSIGRPCCLPSPCVGNCTLFRIEPLLLYLQEVCELYSSGDRARKRSMKHIGDVIISHHR